ncbi:hypothetical protein ACMFMG_001558 [Clarireedia jacksonii]
MDGQESVQSKSSSASFIPFHFNPIQPSRFVPIKVWAKNPSGVTGDGMRREELQLPSILRDILLFKSACLPYRLVVNVRSSLTSVFRLPSFPSSVRSRLSIVL